MDSDSKEKEKQPEIVEASEEALGESAADEQSTPSKKATADLINGRYQVMDLIGEGGMGKVYKALDQKTNETVSLKILKKELASNPTAIKRFEQEAKSISDLDHPNIVSIHDHGQTEDDSPYLVMDWVPGKTLKEILDSDEKLKKDEALRILIEVCSALAHAHKKGMIHRDLKPSNIIVDSTSGEVKLVDFGIAKIQQDDSTKSQNLTETGGFLGSPAYMSPEQCLGEEIDARADIYSLGCIIYEMFAGEQLYAGNNPVQLIAKHLESSTKKLDKRFSKEGKISDSIQSIVLKCLEKKKNDRFKSVDQIAKDLSSIRQGNHIPRYHSITKIKEYFMATGSILILFAVISVLSGFSSMSDLHQQLFVTICGGSFSLVILYYVVHQIKLLMAKFSKTKLLLILFLTSTFTLVAAGIPGDLVKLYGLIIGSSEISNINFLELELKWRFGSIIAFQITGLLFLFAKLWNYTAKLKSKRLFIVIPVIVTLFFLTKGFLASSIVTASHYLVPQQNTESTGVIERSEKILPFYNAALMLDPGNIEVRFGRTLQLISANKNERALKELNELIRLGPKKFGIIYGLEDLYEKRGSLYSKMNKIDLAIKDLERAIEIDPNAIMANYHLANLYEKTGDFDKALKIKNKKIEKSPGRYWNYLGRAQIYEKQGKLDSAIEDTTKCIELKPDEYSGYLQRGLLYKKLGKIHLAAKDFEIVTHEYSYSDKYRNKLKVNKDEKAYNKILQARAYIERNKIESAELALKKARDLGAKENDIKYWKIDELLKGK